MHYTGLDINNIHSDELKCVDKYSSLNENSQGDVFEISSNIIMFPNNLLFSVYNKKSESRLVFLSSNNDGEIKEKYLLIEKKGEEGKSNVDLIKSAEFKILMNIKNIF